MGPAIATLIIWAVSLILLIFVIGAGVRVGMRWSRIDERKEQITRGERPPDQSSTSRKGEPMFDYKPKRTDRRFK